MVNQAYNCSFIIFKEIGKLKKCTILNKIYRSIPSDTGSLNNRWRRR